MKKKILSWVLFVIICITIFWGGKTILKASCCSDLDLDCCCADWSYYGLILDEYGCVCSGGALLVSRCFYVGGYDS